MAKYAVFVALLCVCAVALAIKPVDAELKEFVSYMTKFNKKYSSPSEFQVRYENYQASLQRITQKNKNSKGAVYGVNKFSDMTPAEFKKTMLMRNPIVVNKTQPHPADQVIKPKAGVVAPSSLDWRAKGAVTPVKDQGQCGSCWAFSVTENIESMWILAGKATNETLNLSPQQIVDCDGSDGGCNGGNPPTAYEYVIGAGGLEPVADYPYTAEDGNCAFDKADVSASISNWKYATEFYSETELQNNLVSWGPLSVCVDAEAWQDYQSGVLTWEECAWVNILDHCVQLVGYDETGATPYWIVRNSWGEDWGLGGYILLEKGSDTCGIAHEATCSVV